MDNFNISSWLKKQYLLEAAQNFSPKTVELVDFSFVEGTQMFYGAYIYNRGSKNWDEKLRSKQEVQDFLTSLGIDIQFSFNNLEQIMSALEAKGIKTRESEFDPY